MTNATIAQAESPRPGTVDINTLCESACNGLVPMFDAEKQLFCYSLKRTHQGLVREGLSHRYTVIALLGLHRYQAQGGRVRFDIKAIFSSLLHDRSWVNNLGDLGLLLWLSALAVPERLEEVYSKLVVHGAPSLFGEYRERRTMDLAWFLSGLAHAGVVYGQKLAGVSELAANISELLRQNQGSRGFFGHLHRSKKLAGIVRGSIGSFADQVYPIYALTKFAEAFQVRAALSQAQRCADAICRVQGALGEWWWHYHSQRGRVIERYPVYSVHQHGMAPMALFALSKASGLDFSEPIHKGLQWIAGANDLGVDFRVENAGIVWRSAYHGNMIRKNLRNALSFLGFAGDEPADDLEIKFECRPYELGWLLYAFAGH